MARINFIVPRYKKAKFTGGIWCIMKYAHGLAKRGHTVTVIPILPSPAPLWFPDTNFRLINSTLGERLINTLKLAGSVFANAVKKGKRSTEYVTSLHRLTNALALIEPRLLSFELRKGAILSHVRAVIPEADITIATSFETVIPCVLFGKGQLFYFAQHYEPFFKEESIDPYLAEQEAIATYKLGLPIIANSTWLKKKIEETNPRAIVSVCLNAVDHSIFFGSPRDKSDSTHREIKVISYGGRNAVWKGFRDMAEAIRIARQTISDVDIRWLVYGDAELPPDNEVASYEPLGFLEPGELAQAYRSADILLSASWYESFPLFPLEAMACGLAVITTQSGTEDYALHGTTAEVVPPRDPEQIAAALVRLIKCPEYRLKLARQGNAMAKQLTWERSVSRMEEILLT